MSVVIIVTAFPVPEHRAEVVAAFEEAIARVHGEPGVELYALHEGRDLLVMVEKYEAEQARSEHAKGVRRDTDHERRHCHECGSSRSAVSCRYRRRGDR